MTVPGRAGVREPVEVEVWPAADGLVVYELPWEPDRWVVALASNGWRVGNASWPDRAMALAFADRLEALADWHGGHMVLGVDGELQSRVVAAEAAMAGR